MADGNGFRMSQSQYAKHRGVSQPAIVKLIQRGKLAGAFVKEGGRYLIDPLKADAALEYHRNPARSKQPMTPSVVQGGRLVNGVDPGPAPAIAGNLVSFAEAARREKVARAAILELDLRKKKGDLVEKDKVEAVAAKLGTLVRVGVQAIPSRVAPSIVKLETAGEVARYLQREFNAVLADLAIGIGELEL